MSFNKVMMTIVFGLATQAYADGLQKLESDHIIRYENQLFSVDQGEAVLDLMSNSNSEFAEILDENFDTFEEVDLETLETLLKDSSPSSGSK